MLPPGSSVKWNLTILIRTVGAQIPSLQQYLHSFIPHAGGYEERRLAIFLTSAEADIAPLQHIKEYLFPALGNP